MGMGQKEQSFVIGDVHGCYHTLMKLIDKLPTEAELIFVGDLCDKGKFSKEVIEYVLHHEHTCIKGNHEYLMEKHLYDAVVHDKHAPWSEDYRYGGVSTYQSYLDDHEAMHRHLDWMKRLPLFVQKEHYFISHGFGLPFYEQRQDPAFQEHFLLHRYEEGMLERHDEVINIFGHCVFDDVMEKESFYGIDTGCAYGNKLTAICLETKAIVQVNMDPRDSDYIIRELKLAHLGDVAHTDNLEIFSRSIDEKFAAFDLVATEVLEHMIKLFPHHANHHIKAMLAKKQIFPKQAKKFL